MLKVNDRNTRIRREICLKLTIQIRERGFYSNVSRRRIMFLLLTLNMQLPGGACLQVIAPEKFYLKWIKFRADLITRTKDFQFFPADLISRRTNFWKFHTDYISR